MIIEHRDVDGDQGFGTKNIASIDENASIVPLKIRHLPHCTYEWADLMRDTADMVEDRNDHIVLQNALMESIWDKYGGNKDDVSVNVVEDKNGNE
ncbi:MAG: hypothetical protein AAF551_14810 [Bacteroidota bacterium]